MVTVRTPRLWLEPPVAQHNNLATFEQSEKRMHKQIETGNVSTMINRIMFHNQENLLIEKP